MAGQTPEWLSGAFETAQGYGDPGDAMGMQGNRDAQEALNQRYKQMHANFQAYRPEHANSRMNALNQQLGAFGPINDLIQRMYGQGAGIDLAALGQNPMRGQFDQRTAAEGLFGQFNAYDPRTTDQRLADLGVSSGATPPPASEWTGTGAGVPGSYGKVDHQKVVKDRLSDPNYWIKG